MTYLEVNDTVRVEYRGATALKYRVQAFDEKTVTFVTMEGTEVVYKHRDGVIDSEHGVARVGVLDRADYGDYVPDKRVTITFTRHPVAQGVIRANDGGLLTIQPDNYPNPIYLDLPHLPPEVTSVLLTDVVGLEVQEHTLYEKLINDLPKHKRTPQAMTAVSLTVKRFAELMELSPPPVVPLRWVVPKVKDGPPVVETFEGMVFDVTRVHANKSKVGAYNQRFVEGDRAEVTAYIQCPKLVPFSAVSLPATPLYRRANLNLHFLTFFKVANYLCRTTPPGPINLLPRFNAAFTVFDAIAALEPYRMYTLPVASLKKVRSLVETTIRLHLERVPPVLPSRKNSKPAGTLTDHPGTSSEQLAHMIGRDYGFNFLGAPRRSALWVKYQEHQRLATDRTMAALAKRVEPSPVPPKVLELLAAYHERRSLGFIEQHARASKPEESSDWLYFVDDDIAEHKFVPVFVTRKLQEALLLKSTVIWENLIVDVHSGYSMPYLNVVATNEASPVPPDVVVPKISGEDLPQLSILKKLSHYLSINTEPHYADIVSSVRGKDLVFAVAARLVELSEMSAVARAVVALSASRSSHWQKVKDLTLSQVKFKISEHLRPTPVAPPAKEVWSTFLPLATIPELRLKPIDGLHQYELIRGKLSKFGTELTRQVREGKPSQAVLHYIEQLERHHQPIATLYQFGSRRRITIKEHVAMDYPVTPVELAPVVKDPTILERLKTCLSLPTDDIVNDLAPKCPPLVLYNFIVFAALTVPNLIKNKYRYFKEGETLTKTDKVARLTAPQTTELLTSMNSRLFPIEGDFTEQDAFATKCNIQRKHLQDIVAQADESSLKYCLMRVFDTFITDPEGKLLDDPDYAHAVVHACVKRLISDVDNLRDQRGPI